MADFNNLREQAKQWLSSMFVPKELSPEGVANTGVGAMGMGASALLTPGTMPLMYGLDKFLKTNAGKQIQTMLDASGPLGGGLDDIVVAGAKTAPAALGMVAPLVSNLGRMKPRGVPARPSEWAHSNLAEAVDKAWLAAGEPGDMLSIKQVKSWLNKLPGMGVKKEEIKHFGLADALSEYAGPVEGKISKKALAAYIDTQMPRLEINGGGQRPNQFKDHTLPGGTNYRNHVLQAKPPGDLPNPMMDYYHTENGHWETPDVLMHYRTKDRTLPDGRKALYGEEGQSDWQQNSPETYPLVQNYEDLLQKFLYRQAADEGYDAVAWTPGSVHTQRWGGFKEDSPKPITRVGEINIHHPELWKQYSDEVTIYQLEKYPVDMPNYESKEWQDAIKPIQDKYIAMAEEQGLTVPAKDERFSGFETFYNKRMVDSATGMLKRMGGGKVSETPLINNIVPEDTGRTTSQEPIERILEQYRNQFNPDAGFVQPSPQKSMVYNIRPEDKAAPGAQGWEAPMAGKTVPLWMLLSGMAFDQLRGDKK